MLVAVISFLVCCSQCVFSVWHECVRVSRFSSFLSTLSDSLPIYSIVGCTLLFSDLNKKCTLFLFASASGFCRLFFCSAYVLC